MSREISPDFPQSKVNKKLFYDLLATAFGIAGDNATQADPEDAWWYSPNE
jgi:hypothetical protein